LVLFIFLKINFIYLQRKKIRKWIWKNLN